MSKKYRIYLCKQCGVKRHIFYVGSRGPYRVFKCSKGHVWENKTLSTQEIMNIWDQTFNNIKSLFDRDDIFYKSIKRR